MSRCRTPVAWLTAIVIATLLALAATPAMPQAGPSEAKMGFMVTSLSRIDPADGSFDLSAFAWIMAPDGAFDPANQLQILARRSAIETVQQAPIGDGSTFTGLRIEATLDQAFSLRDFPFDRQTLRINVETEVPADRLRFVPDEHDTRLADYLVVNGWKVTGLRFEERVVRYDTAFGVWRVPDFSRLTLLIDIERQRSALVIEKFIGYTMALLVTALIFLVPTDQIGVRIGMATTAVFAAVGNRYGLDTLIGAETEFGLIEQLSLIVFIAIFAAIATTLLTYELAQNRTRALSNRVNLATGFVVVALSFGLAGLGDPPRPGLKGRQPCACGRTMQRMPVHIIQTVSRRKPTGAARAKTPGSNGITVARPSTRPRRRTAPPASPSQATAVPNRGCRR